MGAGSQRLACLSRMMTFAGYAFSVLTVVINLADVTTDIVVAVQFHEDGDTTWFWLVVSSLIIAHIVYLVMAVEILPEQDAWEWTGRFPRAVRIIAWFPFAQLTPLFNLIGQLIHAYRNSRGTENGIQLLDDPESDAKDADGIQADGMQHVVREELDDIGASKLINSRMQKAIEQHLERYGLFYVESAVEAAPQAIIQLLAITFLGRASPAQLVSLCCSLFSITSKAFVISQAYDARVMAFKFALAAHDVFSTFYLFSTLVAQETTKDTDFFGLEVSWLGYIWLWKIVTYAIVGVISGLISVVTVCIHEYGKERFLGLGMFLAGLALSGPIALVLETVKLFAVAGGVTMTEPPRYQWSLHSIVLSFLANDDWDGTRCRYLAEDNVRLFERNLPRAPSRRRELRRFRRQASKSRQPFSRWWYNTQMDGPMMELKERTEAPGRFTLWSIQDAMSDRRDQQAARAMVRRHQELHELLLMIWIGFCTVVYSLGQLYSFVYPFANAAREFDGHNILQATCFYATCVALVLPLLLSPVSYQYARINVTVRRMFGFAGYTAGDAVKMMMRFHEPPHLGVLQEAVPVRVLPAEVTAMCGAFLTPEDLGLGALTIAECNELKRAVRSRGDHIPILAIADGGTNAPPADEVESDVSASTASSVRRQRRDERRDRRREARQRRQHGYDDGDEVDAVQHRRGRRRPRRYDSDEASSLDAGGDSDQSAAAVGSGDEDEPDVVRGVAAVRPDDAAHPVDADDWRHAIDVPVTPPDGDGAAVAVGPDDPSPAVPAAAAVATEHSPRRTDTPTSEPYGQDEDA